MTAHDVLVARDILTANLITVTVDTPLQEVADLLVRHRIGSIPVLDAAGHVAGIVSEDDFLRRVETGTERRRSRLAAFFTSDAVMQADYVRSRGLRAGDVMQGAPPLIAPDMGLDDIADVLEQHGAHSALVMQEGALVGIISRSDLVRAYVSCAGLRQGTTTCDRAIRETLQAELAKQPWGARCNNNIVVSNGIVHVWGLVASAAEFAAVRVAAERIPGVNGVRDHTVVATQTAPGV